MREFTEKLKGDGFIDKNGGSSRESPVTFQGGYVMCLITEVLAVTLQRRLMQETQRNLIGEVLQGRLINYHYQEEIRDSNHQGKRNREFFFRMKILTGWCLDGGSLLKIELKIWGNSIYRQGVEARESGEAVAAYELHGLVGETTREVTGV